MRIINEIPEEYNDHIPLLLEDFQQGKITLEEVVQILILWNDRGAFVPLGPAVNEADVRLDYFYVNKDRRAEIERELGKLYEFEQKSMR